MTDACRTLLIVDDEPNVLRSLKRLLFETDCKILTAQSGSDGLEMFEKHNIQLVISDFRMPEMDGVEFLAQVKAKHPDTIRIILSGYADVAAIVAAINEGEIYKFVAKPWNDHDLLTTIMRAFEQYDLLQENLILETALREQNRELEAVAQSLEEKVAERTRDLEVKNRALHVAQNILNLLPVGVIGVDGEENLVYANQSAERYFTNSRTGLGQPAREMVSAAVMETIREALQRQERVTSAMPTHDGVCIVCSPLPHGAGIIGLYYCASDLVTLCETAEISKADIEPVEET
ncbi:MAG: response regulator [candidate division Zixibacteria bacterium]|nr:response regulator [candidate division Zixibacteria bacterium]